MLRIFFELITPLLLAVLAADLLYLYSHVWYDPIKAIEIAELIALSFIAILGIISFLIKVKKLRGN